MNTGENNVLDLTAFLGLLGIAIVVTILSSMVGLGGGILFIPILIIGYRIPPNFAVGISLFAMTISTFSATLGYWKHKYVDYKLALAYDIFDIPGIIFGTWLTVILPSIVLSIACGISVCILALLMLLKKSKPEPVPTVQINTENEKNLKINNSFAWKGKNVKWVLLSSFSGGLIAGMVGLGGGTVDTTTMILLGVPVQMACGSSSFAMLLTNLFGFASHELVGNILWDFAIPLGIGSLIGGLIGSVIASKVNGKILKKLLGMVALGSGIRLIFDI